MLDLLLTAALLAGQAPAVTVPPAPMPVVAEAPPTPLPTLSALHQAQTEAHLAKLRVLQLELQIRQQALSDERARLDQAIAAEHPGYRMDWERVQLVRVDPVADKERPQ